MRSHRRQPTRLFCPWDSQARILGWVAISFSNACRHAKSLQSRLTLCDPMDGSPPGSSVPGVLMQEYVAKRWTGVPALRQQLPTLASLPVQPAGIHTLTVTHIHEHCGRTLGGTHRHTASQETEVAGPLQVSASGATHSVTRGRRRFDAPAPPLPGGKHLAIWNVSGLSMCKQVVFRTCLIKRQQTTQPGIESSWSPWEGGLFSACWGLPPAPRPSAQVSPYVKSSEVEPLSESGAPPSLHEAGNVSNCPICFLDLSSIPLKSGIKL